MSDDTRDPENPLLAAGGHTPNEGAGCVMEWVGVKWLMHHGYSLTDAWAQLTDTPPCTDRLIWTAAQRVNDQLDDTERQRLVAFIPRLMRAHTPTDPVKARRVRVRVSCWAARSVLHLIRDDERRAVALRAIETAEAWLRGEADERQSRAAAAAADAYAYAYAAAAAAAAAYADAYADAYAAAAAAAAAARRGETDLVLWLDELLDQWEKACAEEGCAADEAPIPEGANA